jgi:hypothetical protein
LQEAADAATAKFNALQRDYHAARDAMKSTKAALFKARQPK